MPASPRQPSREKLSKIPSWIMLGVVLGGIGFHGVQSVFEERRGKKQSAPAPAAHAGGAPDAAGGGAGKGAGGGGGDGASAGGGSASAGVRAGGGGGASAAGRRDAHMSLFAIDAVFRAYGAGAVWEHDLTEIVLWNPATQGYGTGIEVLRNGDVYYYRLLDRLTRPVLTEGVDPDAPIRLTEPASYQERRRQQRLDAWRSRPAAPPPPPPLAPLAPPPATAPAARPAAPVPLAPAAAPAAIPVATPAATPAATIAIPAPATLAPPAPSASSAAPATSAPPPANAR
ncbi:MAG: hypothetical protein LBC18_07865 [Opitutaceae bacterium]|jgi:hypothetical protein|nr:hypothetical protein [Opitutaceae bacterium]